MSEIIGEKVARMMPCDEEQIGETLFLYGPPHDIRHVDQKLVWDLIDKGAKLRQVGGVLYIYMRREAGIHA